VIVANSRSAVFGVRVMHFLACAPQFLASIHVYRDVFSSCFLNVIQFVRFRL